MKTAVKIFLIVFSCLITTAFLTFLLYLALPGMNNIYLYVFFIAVSGLAVSLSVYRIISDLENAKAILAEIPEINMTGTLTAAIIELKRVFLNYQQNLKRSEEQFRVFADNRYELIARFTAENLITFINKPFARFIGQKPDQLTGKNILDFFDSSSDFYVNGLQRPMDAISQERKFDFCKDSYWLEWFFSSILNSGGELITYQLMGHDITERKRVEEALKDSKARNLALLKAIPDLVFRFHSDGSLLDYHLPPSENSRIPSERLLTNNIEGVFSEELTEKIRVVLNEAFQTGDIQLFEHETIEDEETYYQEIRVVAAEQDEYIIIIRDITERKKAEEEINKYIEEMQFNEDILAKNAFELQELYGKLTESEIELKELNAKKDKFFSIISHDLRSPFTAIVGFSRILVEDFHELPPDQIKSFAQNIYEASENVLKLLENLLYWSRLQTNRIQYEPQQLILKTVIDDIVGLYKANALEKNITFINKIPAAAIAWADKNMLDAVLRNLVSNALKFTRNSGTITIGGQKKEDLVEVYIQDNGIGISEENLSRLFKIDEHITTQGTNKEKGTGLGLILCKEFIERNGGTISVESKLNTGTNFIFTLPTA